jgi:hypothetical protein
MHGDDQLIIPAESWPAVRTELAELLVTAESGGAAAARRWLKSRGLTLDSRRSDTAPCCARRVKNAVPPSKKVLNTLSRLGYAGLRSSPRGDRQWNQKIKSCASAMPPLKIWSPECSRLAAPKALQILQLISQ